MTTKEIAARLKELCSQGEFEKALDGEAQRQPDGIGKSMDFAALCLLSRDIAHAAGRAGGRLFCFGPPLFRRLDRLAVDCSGSGAGLATGMLAQCGVERIPDFRPCPVALELAEDGVAGGARRKIPARQRAPRAARAQQKQDGVHRLAHAGRARSPARIGGSRIARSATPKWPG